MQDPGISRAGRSTWTKKEFKKHLQDLAHGHHHPEEHDWSPDSNVRKAEDRVNTNRPKSAKSVVQKAKRRAK